jgi:hypothetical protein
MELKFPARVHVGSLNNAVLGASRQYLDWRECGFFAGACPCCSNVATVGFNINQEELSPSLNKRRPAECNRCLQRGSVMPSVKTIVTLASVVAIASSIFAFSWVGLALLGF